MATTANTAPPLPEPDNDLHTIAAEQRRELMAAEAFESDLDLAFELQMQEALTASLSLQPSPSSSSTPPNPPQFLQNKDDAFHFSALQSEELDKFEREHRDRLLAEAEMNRIKEDLRRRAHDRDVAAQILRIPDDVWEEHGDNFERPYGEGTSKGRDATFRVYCKGVVSEETTKDSKVVTFAGIGVAVCDSADCLISELRKPLFGVGRSRQAVEMKALIEGLSAAIALDLKRVVFYIDYYPLYQFVIGRWPPKQRKIAALVSRVNQLRDKFVYSAPSLVTRNDIKFAFKLAREAIVSQVNGPLKSSCGKNMYETCAICLEDKDVGQIFSVDDCLHRYCYSCMKQHVEVKLLHGMVAKCPYEGCNSELKIESCRIFLTPKLIEMLTQRLTEASIPVTERVYCPYPKCSFLMTKTEVLEYSKNTISMADPGVRKCMKCEDLFCLNCKVPWHTNMSCHVYKIRNPHPPAGDAKLKTLADRNLWRQCIKCNHMIELATGCYHMTCRCGNEFCYTCGAEWKNKKATCSCPLWDEENILDDEDEDEDEVSDEESDEEDYYDDAYESDSDDY